MNLFGKGSVAAVAVAAGLALGASGAAAQGFLADSSWYVKGFGGATWPQDDDFDLGITGGPTLLNDSGFDYDTGYVLGIAGGLMVTPNIAVELEYAYRNADAELKGTDSGSKQTESNAWMANAIYWFNPIGPTGQWQPYAGGGLGAADFNFEEVDPLAGGDFDSDYQFAYQLIGGVAYNITPNWSLNGEVRFFGINDQDVENGDFEFQTNYQTFDLLIGATYHF